MIPQILQHGNRLLLNGNTIQISDACDFTVNSKGEPWYEYPVDRAVQFGLYPTINALTGEPINYGPPIN